MIPSSDLLEIVASGIKAVRPSTLFPSILADTQGPVVSWTGASKRFLLALGKASIDSAKSVLSCITCDNYFVLAPYEDPDHEVRVHIGSHPIPDQRSFDSTVKLLEWLGRLRAGGSLLVILSGGTSALCAHPLSTLSLQSKMIVNDLLIRSGAPIQEINTVRKHLSAVKGGQLASRTTHLDSLVLVISDVIGDDLSAIGSGPFYPDPTTFLDARRVLENYDLWNRVPEEVRATLEAGIAGSIPETPKPGTGNVRHRIIASNEIARKAAADRARGLGYQVHQVEEPLNSDVEEAVRILFSKIERSPTRTAIIAGGEVTIRLQGQGIGGRNQHLALLMTKKLQDSKILFGAVGTDGIDGNSPAAGAWTDGGTFTKAARTESYDNAVRNFDSYRYFESIGQNIKTGPTGTNVMDLYIALK